MIAPSVARKYAKALVEVAAARGTLPRVLEEVRFIAERADEDAELRSFLESRAYPETAKRGLILALFERAQPDGIDPTTRNFVEALALHHRLSDYLAIVDVLQAAADNQAGVLRARVVTATPLSDEQQGQLSDALARATSSQIRLEADVSPELLGGVLTQIGSTIYDGSVRTRLVRMKEQLARGQ